MCITERRSGKPLLFHFNFEPGALGPGARNFHYTTVPAKNQLTKCTNLTPLFIPIFVQHYLLTFGCSCAIIINVKRQGRVIQGLCDLMTIVLSMRGWTVTDQSQLQHLKKFLKKFQKPLDKRHKVCYNYKCQGRQNPQSCRHKGEEPKGCARNFGFKRCISKSLKFFEKISKNPLTNGTRCAIIVNVKGREKTSRTECLVATNECHQNNLKIF